MERVRNISKEDLLNCLLNGISIKDIATKYSCSRSWIEKLIKRNDMGTYVNRRYDSPFKFEKIDSKEKAYVLGFIIADSAIEDSSIDLKIAIKDRELLEFIVSVIGGNIKTNHTLIRETRRFPFVRLSRKIKDIKKFVGDFKKVNRNVPIIQKDLEVYLIRGIFDGNGCITWGRRKDRNRVWQKVTFSSSLSILTSVQKVLYKIGISTCVRPKGKENCFILEFGDKKDVLKFYDYLYADTSFVPLKRKFNKYNALRLELGELRETTSKNCTILSEAVDLSTERAETTGGLNGVLNHQNSAQGSNKLRYSPNGGINVKPFYQSSRC